MAERFDLNCRGKRSRLEFSLSSDPALMKQSVDEESAIDIARCFSLDAFTKFVH